MERTIKADNPSVDHPVDGWFGEPCVTLTSDGERDEDGEEVGEDGEFED